MSRIFNRFLGTLTNDPLVTVRIVRDTLSKTFLDARFSCEEANRFVRIATDGSLAAQIASKTVMGRPKPATCGRVENRPVLRSSDSPLAFCVSAREDRDGESTQHGQSQRNSIFTSIGPFQSVCARTRLDRERLLSGLPNRR